MTLLKILASMMLMFAAGCASVEAPSGPPAIYVMRHLHTPAGVPDPDLAPVGQDHARRLSDWFRRDPPRAIFVSPTKRAQQTAAPLANRLGLVPIVYDPADTAGLIARALQQRGSVLIVGHSNTVPDIIRRLGAQGPQALTHEEFADIWRVRAGAVSHWKLPAAGP